MAELALASQTDAPAPTSLALECLVVIGRRYGLNLTVDQIVKDNRLASAEITTDQLLVCSERAGFRCRALRARWSLLAEMQGALPAIVRFTDGRHAVLLRVDDRDGAQQVVVQQPRQGEDEPPAILDRRAFESVWSGDILLIKRSLGLAEQERPFDFETVATIVAADRPAARDLLISTAALSVLGIAPIIFAQLLLTYVLSYPAFGTFFLLCVGMAILIAFEGGFLALRRSILGRMSTRLEHDLSGYAFERMLRLPVDYFESTPVGVTTQRMAQVSAIAGSLGGRAVSTVFDIGVAVVALPIMLYDSLPLTAVVLAFCALTVAWTLFMTGRLRARAAAVAKVEAERSAFVSESIGAFGTIKALSLDARQRQRWDVLTARVTRLRLAESGSANLLQTVATPLEWLMVFGTFGLGIVLANRAAATSGTALPGTLGVLFAFLMLTQRLAAPIRHLATLVRETDEFRRAVATLGALLNEPVEEGHNGEGVRLPLRGRIEFNNVTFSYPGTTSPALQAITFDVPVGTTLGIMGRSGSGKTTIARLLQKFHADYQGLIKIDGIDARDYEMGHLRNSLGVVLQDTFLFRGTIRDNITAAKPDATDEDLFHAARMAGADEFIERLPLGYETMLLEGAVNLSDGQRQRLAIARAVIADPRVLVLDEATSALDPESEAIVNGNLKRFSNNRTTITLSHRFSALANADMILVLDRGEVQDMGLHAELLERCDIYSGLWHRRKKVLEGPAHPEALLPSGSHVA